MQGDTQIRLHKIGKNSEHSVIGGRRSSLEPVGLERPLTSRYGTPDGGHRYPWGIHAPQVVLAVVGSMGYMRYPEPARARAIPAAVQLGSARLLPTRAV